MKLNIAVLPGDGIGPEIAAQGVEVMSAVCKKFGPNFLATGQCIFTDLFFYKGR